MNRVLLKLILLAVPLLFIFACQRNEQPIVKVATDDIQATQLESAPEITSEREEEDWHDLVFFIENQKYSKSGSQILTVTGRHKGEKLRFAVELSETWKKTNSPIFPLTGTVHYLRTGKDSDVFLKVLDQIFKTNLTPERMQDQVKFNVITLKGTPNDLSSGPVKMKLFFEPDIQDRYAEVYTNIDLKKKRLELLEKDPEYRVNIIKAFGQM